MVKILFFLFSFLSIFLTINSFTCEESVNLCLKCNPLTNLCLRYDLEIYAPDTSRGCENAKHCEAGKNYCSNVMKKKIFVKLVK
jgi:hypothetical protein